MGRPIGSSDGVMEKAQIVQQNMYLDCRRLSHSNGYYCIIVLYISLSCMLASLGKADAGCDDPCPCQPDKAIDGETFTALLSSRRHVCSQHRSLGVSATAREQERDVVGVESCHVMSSRFTRLVHEGPTSIGRTSVQRACALYVGRARRTANRDNWVGRLA
jgi:hypothetical protein